MIITEPKWKSYVVETIEPIFTAKLCKEIIDLRKKAYPSWQDQLDSIYHNGVEGWKADIITPIKEKYPKR